MPVEEHRWQAGQQSVCRIVLLGEVSLGLEVAEKRNTRALHIHWMCIRRNHFQDFLKVLRKAAERFQFCDVGVELCLRWQMVVQQEVCNLFEARIIREIVDVIASISQARAFFANRAQGRLACSYAGETAGFF